MKKSLLAAVALILIAVNAQASGGKIACFDFQTVYNKTALGKKYQVIARGYYESRKKMLDTDADEIQRLQEENNKQKLEKPNEPAQKEKEEVLNRKIAQFKRFVLSSATKSTKRMKNCRMRSMSRLLPCSRPSQNGRICPSS